MRRRSTWIAITGLAVSAKLLLGCAFGEINWDDPLKRQFTLQDTQKIYTDFVRWSAFDKASRYVDPEVRDEYLRRAPSTRELRFTDYEMVPIEMEGKMEGEMDEAKIEVTYYAYRTSSPIETTVKELQHWRRYGKGNTWMVTPTFPDLGDATTLDNER